jgi:hypothetical protein
MLTEAVKFKKDWQAAQKVRLDNGVEQDSYVYVHLQEDTGEPFYVGIGFTVTRPWAMNHHSRKNKHKNIAAKHGVRVQIVIDGITLEQACDWEVHWIKMLRNAGYRLANLTDGGEGTKGMKAHNRKRVLCLETNELFETATYAAKVFNAPVSCITSACNLDTRYAQGMHFIYSNVKLSEHERNSKIREIEMHCASRRKKVESVKYPDSSIVDGKDSKGRSAAGPMKNARKVISVTDGISFPSASAAARHYNVSKSAVIELCLGKNNRKTVGGIKFKYVEEF